MLGEERPGATAIAFAADAVWLGTERGLFRWDRRNRFWARVAVAGRHMSPKVTALNMDQERLNVAVEIDGKAQTLSFDVKKGSWRE